MATERSPFIKLAVEMLDETWTNDEFAMIVRLMLLFRRRYIQGQMVGPGAIELGTADAVRVAGTPSCKACADRLARVPALVSASMVKDGRKYLCSWPKFSELQCLKPRKLPEARPKSAPSDRGEMKEGRGKKKKEKDLAGGAGEELPLKPSRKPNRRKRPTARGSATPLPDELDPQDEVYVRTWAAYVMPKRPAGDVSREIELALGSLQLDPRQSKMTSKHWGNAVRNKIQFRLNAEKGKAGEPRLASLMESKNRNVHPPEFYKHMARISGMLDGYRDQGYDVDDWLKADEWNDLRKSLEVTERGVAT